MEKLDRLLKILCDERGEAVPQKLTERQKADWFRALCNVRPPMPVSEEFLLLQNEYLTERAAERGHCRCGTICLPGSDCAMAGGHHPIKGGRHRQCLQFGAFGVL